MADKAVVRAKAAEVQRLFAEGRLWGEVAALTGIPKGSIAFYRDYDLNRTLPEGKQHNRQPRPPAWNDHPDRGCDESPRCTECPLPACKFDRPEKPERQRVPPTTVPAPRRGNDMAELNTVTRPSVDGVFPTAPRPAGPVDWIAAAKAELARLIADVEVMGTKKQRAEQITAALRAMNVADIQPMPWRGAARKPTDSDKTSGAA